MFKDRFTDKGKKAKGNTFCFLIFTFYLSYFSLSSWAQVPLDWGPRGTAGRLETDSDRLFSPFVGQRFYEIGYELANCEEIGKAEVEQALVFFNATMNLDKRANYVVPEAIKLACRYPAGEILTTEDPQDAENESELNSAASAKSAVRERDYSQLVSQLLRDYVDESADLEVAKKAVWYLLEQLNSREHREKFLEGLLQNLGGRNTGLDSELATLLGLIPRQTVG